MLTDLALLTMCDTVCVLCFWHLVNRNEISEVRRQTFTKTCKAWMLNLPLLNYQWPCENAMWWKVAQLKEQW